MRRPAPPCGTAVQTAAYEQVVRRWAQIADRTGEIVPAYGFTQAERELASAGMDAPVAAVR